MRPHSHHKLLLSLELVTVLLLLCLKFIKTSKNPYKYENPIIIINFISIAAPFCFACLIRFLHRPVWVAAQHGNPQPDPLDDDAQHTEHLPKIIQWLE
jgi:hypothetical protein